MKLKEQRQMKDGITAFVSYNHDDRGFARFLADFLESQGIDAWLDERRIRIGDAITDKIEEGLSKTDVFFIVLSERSVTAPWVKEELRIAISKRASSENRFRIFPILIDDCQVPLFLQGYLYADFRDPENYSAQLIRILDAIVFNEELIDKYQHRFPANAIVEDAYIECQLDGPNQESGVFKERVVRLPIRPTRLLTKEIVLDGELSDFLCSDGDISLRKKSRTTYHIEVTWEPARKVGQPYAVDMSWKSTNEFRIAKTWYYKIEAPTRRFRARFIFDEDRAPRIFGVSTTRSLAKVEDVKVKPQCIGGKAIFEFGTEFPNYQDQFEFQWD